MMSASKKMTYTVKQASETTGLSPAIVRRYCQNGGVDGVKYNEIPGTARGYYELSQKAVDWLRDNVTRRTVSVT